MFGAIDLQATAEIAPGEARFRLLEIGQLALSHDVPTAHSRSWPEIDEQIGSPHRIFIVFYDDQRIAKISQSLKRLQQPVIVPRMKPDRGLIQHIKDTYQTRTDLTRQPDPLRLTPDKVGAVRAKQRYDSPTSSKNPSREVTSFNASTAICC